MSMNDRDQVDTTNGVRGVSRSMGRTGRALVAFVALYAVGGLAACGSEDKPGPSAEPGTDGSVSDKFTCGSDVCELPEGMSGELCCVDQFSGGCGLMQGAECRRLPERDDRCPDITASATIRGVPCCAQNGECGIDLGVGCLSTVENCALFPRAVVEQLGRQSCDGDKLELAADCGRASTP